MDIVQLLITTQALSTRVIHTLTVTTLSHGSSYFFYLPSANKQLEETLRRR